MSDSYAEEIAKSPEPEHPQGRSVSLTITLHPNGHLELSGPLMNKVLANGLLGAATQELHRLHLVNELQASATTKNGVSGLLKRMGTG